MSRSEVSFEKPLEVALKDILDRATCEGCPSKLRQALHHALFPGGARVRPKILLAVANACAIENPRLALAGASALEMIHCASLVHDDMPCFDDAALRRGKPSTHVLYGEEIALLTGDSLIVHAFEAIAHTPDADANIKLALIQALAKYTGAPRGICAGQAWESEPKIDLGHYHRSKTGALFIAATEMGALAAGQNQELWSELGSRIGEAYQIADDLMDVFSSEKDLGKPVKQDGAHARPNAVEILGLDGAASRLEDMLAAAIASIPKCPGEAELAKIVKAQSDRFLPLLNRTSAV